MAIIAAKWCFFISFSIFVWLSKEKEFQKAAKRDEYKKEVDDWHHKYEAAIHEKAPQKHPAWELWDKSCNDSFAKLVTCEYLFIF